MLNKLKKSNKDGFTIIEVMIVLAIAALILLIVFLAVPALQRTSRNTQRKNDAAAISAALANFLTDNNGTLPVSLGLNPNDATGTVDICAGGGNAQGGVIGCTTTMPIETAKLGIYTAKEIYINTAYTAITVGTPGSTPSATNVNVNSAVVVTGFACNTTNTGVGNANPRDMVVIYVTESNSGSGNEQCVEQ